MMLAPDALGEPVSPAANASPAKAVAATGWPSEGVALGWSAGSGFGLANGVALADAENASSVEDDRSWF